MIIPVSARVKFKKCSSLILLLLLVVIYGSCKPSHGDESSILLGFKLGSEQHVWKDLLLDLSRKFPTDKSPHEHQFYRVDKPIRFDQDTVLCQYRVNEPFQFGRLREVEIELTRPSVPGIDDRGAIGFGRPLRKSDVQDILRHLNDIYGRYDNVVEDQRFPERSEPVKIKRYEWTEAGYSVSITYDNYEYRSFYSDSISNNVTILARTGEWLKDIEQDRKMFLLTKKAGDVVDVRLGEHPYFMSSKNGQIVIAQTLNYIEHRNLGYGKKVVAVKFDILISNRFNEQILLLNDVEVDTKLEMGMNHSYAIGRTIGGDTSYGILSWKLRNADAEKCKRYINNDKDQLTATVENLKVLYEDDGVLQN